MTDLEKPRFPNREHASSELPNVGPQVLAVIKAVMEKSSPHFSGGEEDPDEYPDGQD